MKWLTFMRQQHPYKKAGLVGFVGLSVMCLQGCCDLQISKASVQSQQPRAVRKGNLDTTTLAKVCETNVLAHGRVVLTIAYNLPKGDRIPTDLGRTAGSITHVSTPHEPINEVIGEITYTEGEHGKRYLAVDLTPLMVAGTNSFFYETSGISHRFWEFWARDPEASFELRDDDRVLDVRECIKGNSILWQAYAKMWKIDYEPTSIR